MNVKEWLQRAWDIEKEIRELEERRQTARDDALRITASYEYKGNQSLPSGNGNEAKYIKLVDFERQLDEQIKELYTVKLEIDTAIDQVSNQKLRRLLKLRYIDFKTWEDIAEHFGYIDIRWTYRLHDRALKKIGEVLNLS